MPQPQILLSIGKTAVCHAFAGWAQSQGRWAGRPSENLGRRLSPDVNHFGWRGCRASPENRR